MKTANTFYWTFIDTLVYNVATIAAIVVGVCQYLIRAYNDNNGNEKVRKVIQTVLAFVDTIVEHGKVYFADPVTPAKVEQKRTKRRWFVPYYIRWYKSNGTNSSTTQGICWAFDSAAG